MTTAQTTDVLGQQKLETSDPLIRQRERTVDNVKRLYAVIFSLSVTNFVREIFETVKANQHDMLPVFDALLIQFIMLMIFFFTAAVFFFQTDRFLDIRYGMLIPDSLSADGKSLRVTPWTSVRFAFDYCALVFTLLPFMVMSFAMDPQIVKSYGIVPFYLAYIVLLQGSCILLVPYSIGRLHAAATSGVTVTASETARYAALSNHWILLNSTTVLILQCLFWSQHKNGGLCRLAFTPAENMFIFWFAVVAIIRNVADFRTVWPFLYLSSWRIAPRDRFGLLWLILRDDLTVRRDWMEFLALGSLLAACALTIGQLYLPVLKLLGRC